MHPSYLLIYLGAGIRWSFGLLLNKTIGKKLFSYKEYLNGIENPKNLMDDKTSQRFVNGLIGLAFIISTLIILVKLL